MGQPSTDNRITATFFDTLRLPAVHIMAVYSTRRDFFGTRAWVRRVAQCGSAFEFCSRVSAGVQVAIGSGKEVQIPHHKTRSAAELRYSPPLSSLSAHAPVP